MNRDLIYNPREKTDVLFHMLDGNFHYQGFADQKIRYVEKNYLCNPDTWTEFVKVFHKHTDTWGFDGEFWGKMMRGAVLTYQYTQNGELYDILTDAVEDMLTAQRPNGEFSTYVSDKEFSGWDMWCRKYVLLGFEYYLEICKDDALASRIVTAVCEHADYIMEYIGNPEDGKILITNASRDWLGLPASSILEPYVRLYNLTGEKRYLDFAGYIVDNGGIENGNLWEDAYLDEKYPYQYKTRKAYEMMSCFEGLLEYYRVTGIKKYKTAAVRFAKRVIESDITIIGCAGCEHELFDHSARTQLDTESGSIMQETCVTVTWMKLCHQLLLLTGDPIFADQIELSAYNAMSGAVNDYGIKDAIEGMPFDSYSPLMFSTRARLSGGYRELEKINYGCCGSIGSAGTALMAISSAMTSRDGIYLNLYYQGEINAISPSGNPYTLKINTNYPEENDVQVTYISATDEKMKIAVRIPSYSKNNMISVNGETAYSVQNGYSVIDRLWKHGDTIDISIDTRVRVFRTAGVDNNSQYHIALYKGPVVLARDARLGEPIDSVVDVIEDEKGFVVYESVAHAEFPVNMEYRIPNRDGSYFTVIDYASAGKTYNRDSVMTAWLATKNYWSVDITKSFTLANRAIEGRRYLCIGDENDVHACFDASMAAIWTPEDAGDGYVRLNNGCGKYLTVSDDQPDTYASVEAFAENDRQIWKLDHFIRNCFVIVHKKSRCTLYEDQNNQKYRLFSTETDSDKRYPSKFKNNNTNVNVLFYVKNISM